MARSSVRVALLSFPRNCDSLQDETLWKIPLRNSRPTSRSDRRRHCGTCVALPVCHRWEEEEEGKPSQRRASNHLYMICLPGFLFQIQGERSVICERSWSEPLQELWRGIPLGNGPELKKEPHPLVDRGRAPGSRYSHVSRPQEIMNGSTRLLPHQMATVLTEENPHF